MADITQLRFAQLLRRTFGLKGTGGDPGRVIAPVIGAQFDVADPYRPEDRVLRGEKNFTLVNSGVNALGGPFARMFVNNLPNSGRLVVVKRVTFSFLMPTATTQPGLVYLAIQAPVVAVAAGTSAQTKDGRVGTPGAVSVSGPVSTIAATPLTTMFVISSYFVQVFPGAAVVPTIHQIDNLDVVLPPGTAMPLMLAGDTNPAAGYAWLACIEGYERSVDVNELLTPPP